MHDHRPVHCSVVYELYLDKQIGEGCQSFPALLHWRFIQAVYDMVIIVFLRKSFVAKPFHSEALSFTLVKNL